MPLKFTQRRNGELRADVRITMPLTQKEVDDLKQMAFVVYGRKSMWRQILLDAISDGLASRYLSVSFAEVANA